MTSLTECTQILKVRTYAATSILKSDPESFKNFYASIPSSAPKTVDALTNSKGINDHHITWVIAPPSKGHDKVAGRFSKAVEILLIPILLALYFLPFIIAFYRRHSYKWVIFGLNAVGFSGVTWLISFVWAVWPSEKSLIDPLAGNVTGTGRRNTGDTIGSIEYGRERGYEEEKNR